MTEDARTLLLAEIEKSKTPYYFMGSLAYVEEEEGNDAVALEWRRKAYEASEGPATRIRWWASYVQALTRLAPENGAAILQAAMYPFDPEQGMSDLFAGANKRNLQRAKNALEEWDMEETELDEFHAALVEACAEAGADCTEL
jgi:protein disulfide-isomerase